MRWFWQPPGGVVGPTLPEAVGGAVVVPGAEDSRKQQTSDWQTIAWELWPELGELYFPTSYMARQVGRVDWDVLPETVGEDQEVKPLDKASPERAQILDAVSRGLGPEEASDKIAINLLVAGDGNYVRMDDETFRVVSVIDPKRADLLKSQELKPRFFNPDPRDPDKATSSMRAALIPAEELLDLSKLLRVQTRSRIQRSGMLLWPTEDKNQSAPATLEASMMAATEDIESPAAYMPVTKFMDSRLIPESAGGPRFLDFTRSFDEQVTEKMEVATKRIALALDIPAELLLGLGDLNHWTAWLVSEEAYTAHVGPLAQQVGEVFTHVARKLGHAVTIVPDPSELLARRSTVRDALDGAELGAVGLAYVRDAMGADDDDQPTDQDIETILALKGSAREPTVEENPGAPEAVAAAVNLIDLDGLSGDLQKIDTGLMGELVGMVKMAGDRANEKIGARVKTMARSDAALRDEINGTPTEEIGAKLGTRRLGALAVDYEVCTEDAIRALSKHWQTRVPQAYRQVEKLGVPIRADVGALADRSTMLLAAGARDWVVANLDRPEPLEVPTNLLRLVLATAGGQ
jgi:hypothetical protein